MKALVTGATGFIGSSIVRELLKDNVDVKVLIRKESNTKNIDGLDVEKAYGDIRDKESVKAALKGCDVFYQTAALFTNWAPDKKIFWDINVEGTKAALSAALEQGIGKVVYTSSVAAVGYEEGKKLANETTQFNYKNPGPYMLTKYLSELEAMKFVKQGLPVVVVNPCGPIGARDIKPTPTGQMILNVLNRKMPGYVDAGINFAAVEDIARGHIGAAQKGKIGERYILGNQNISFKDYFELIAEIGKVEPPKRKISHAMGMTIAGIYEFISAINRKPPLISLATARQIGHYAYYDCSKAIKELGIPQTPLKTAIENAISWFRENGYIHIDSKT